MEEPCGVLSLPNHACFLRIFTMNFPLEKPPGLVLFSTESKFLMFSGAQVLQLGPTFCDPMDCSPLGSSISGILQARILEWIAVPSSRGSSRPRDGSWVSCTAGGFFTVWATREAPCSLGTCQTVQRGEGEQRGESWSPCGRLERNRASWQEPTPTKQCGQSATSVRIWAEEQLYSGWVWGLKCAV